MPDTQPQTSLQFREFMELLLGLLFLYERDHPDTHNYVSLNALTQRLKTPFPGKWLYDACKVLESRLLMRGLYALGGYCYGELTGEGRLFIEEERGTGIIKKLLARPGDYLIDGSLSRVPNAENGKESTNLENIREQRRAIFDLIADIRDRIKDDVDLNEGAKHDRLHDLESLEKQLEKREPNRDVLAAIIDDLSDIQSVAGQTGELIRLINM